MCPYQITAIDATLGTMDSDPRDQGIQEGGSLDSDQSFHDIPEDHGVGFDQNDQDSVEDEESYNGTSYWARPFRVQNELYNLRDIKHTWDDLENAVTERMIEECKLDACLDFYLKSTAKIRPPKPRSPWRDPSPDPAWEGEDTEKRNRVLDELRTNLNALVPGYVEFIESDVWENDKLADRLTERDPLRIQNVFNTAGDNADSFRGALLDTLAEQRYQRRSHRDQSGLEACLQLRDYIEGQSASASFTCGGTIPIGDPSTINSASSRVRHSTPVNIFWALESKSDASKLVLPLTDNALEASNSTLQQLVNDCAPATFGKGDQDVLDPEYRRAGKMDPSHFATSFHPADFGIIENIEQILLPSISSETQSSLGFRKLTAELYKLNVYSGPSGLFRKHVDTSRSEQQIGSLVVCLPSEFKGGIFTVQHDKQKVEFDWSKQSKSAIQWAAFYSDCEHEIETVTEGERITLTYNLYVTKPVGSVSAKDGIVQTQSLPLYGFMKNLISEDTFMNQGGVLGIYCSHSYPHNSDIADLQIPRGLKGADLVLYSVFTSLGIEADVLPVLKWEGKYGSENQMLEVESAVEDLENSYIRGDDDIDPWLRFLKNGEMPKKIKSSEFLPPGIVDAMDINQYWKLLLMSRRVDGMRDVAEYAKKEGVAVGGVYAAEGVRVGTELRPYDVTDYGYDQTLDDVSKLVWPTYYLPGIVWINEPKHEEMAFSHVVYGNDAGVGTRYSAAAILAVIPPAKDRKRILDQL